MVKIVLNLYHVCTSPVLIWYTFFNSFEPILEKSLPRKKKINENNRIIQR